MRKRSMAMELSVATGEQCPVPECPVPSTTTGAPAPELPKAPCVPDLDSAEPKEHSGKMWTSLYFLQFHYLQGPGAGLSSFSPCPWEANRATETMDVTQA